MHPYLVEDKVMERYKESKNTATVGGSEACTMPKTGRKANSWYQSKVDKGRVKQTNPRPFLSSASSDYILVTDEGSLRAF